MAGKSTIIYSVFFCIWGYLPSSFPNIKSPLHSIDGKTAKYFKIKAKYFIDGIKYQSSVEYNGETKRELIIYGDQTKW